MAYLITLVVILATASIWWQVRRRRHEDAIRQSSYGNAKIYNVLKTPSGYDSLKLLMQETETFDHRYLYSLGISRLFPLKVLQQWVADEPESADAWLCYGARMLQWAWEARGYGRATDVSRKKWETFFHRLEKTWEILSKCADLMPSDPTPWTYLIMVSTWGSDEQEDRWHYFEQAKERDPNNWPAHMHMIIALSEKWGGSNDEMIEFAKHTADDAPEGSELPIILIKAYLEYWKYLEVFNDNPEDANRFLNSMPAQTRALRAYEKSLGSSEHGETPVSVFVRYNASAWFWLVRDKQRLTSELDTLGDHLEDIHWRWTGAEGDLDGARAFANPMQQ